MSFPQQWLTVIIKVEWRRICHVSPLTPSPAPLHLWSRCSCCSWLHGQGSDTPHCHHTNARGFMHRRHLSLRSSLLQKIVWNLWELYNLFSFFLSADKFWRAERIAGSHSPSYGVDKQLCDLLSQYIFNHGLLISASRNMASMCPSETQSLN